VRSIPDLVFTTPRNLPDARKLRGRVAVVDIAFAADGMGTPFDETTGTFIRALGGRLAAWVDHHDHERQAEFKADPRFVLATKAEHGACPEMVTPEVVRNAGPIDTVVAHVDLDGLYAAAKWILDGREPYAGADDDARAVDTRIGQPGPIGEMVDKALRAHFRDEGLKHRIVRWLVDGMKDKALGREIKEAAADFDRMADEAHRLARLFERRGRAVYVDAAQHADRAYDKTLLLLEGQKLAEVAIVRDSGSIAVAAAFDSGIDFVKLFGLGGGMPTRVSLPESRLDEVLEKLNVETSKPEK
jgi:hypothetical protein